MATLYGVSIAIGQSLKVLQLMCWREIILDICGCMLDNILINTLIDWEIAMWWYSNQGCTAKALCNV